MLDSVEQLLQEKDAILDELQFNLVKAQHRMSRYANKKRREVELMEGDFVFLKIQPYKQKMLARRINKKLW